MMAINLNPAHKGLFTQKANRKGMTVQQFAVEVLTNPEKYPGVTRQEANFARVQRGWKKGGHKKK
jgi:hypothetical protein